MSFWKTKQVEAEPIEVVKELPKTIPEFEAWSDKIIELANLPTQNTETQKFALASMLLQIKPDQSYKSNMYFASLLKKAATDQLATQVIDNLRLARAQRLDKELKEGTEN